MQIRKVPKRKNSENLGDTHQQNNKRIFFKLEEQNLQIERRLLSSQHNGNKYTHTKLRYIVMKFLEHSEQR